MRWKGIEGISCIEGRRYRNIARKAGILM